LTRSVVAVDSEWVDFDLDKHPAYNARPFCFTFAYRDDKGHMILAYLQTDGPGSDGNTRLLDPFWHEPKIRKIGHNVPVDWHVIVNEGATPVNFCTDTMVMDFLFNENREYNHGLKECVRDHLGRLDREPYAKKFGIPRLKKDGTPYANGAVDIPSLRDVCSTEEGFQKLVSYAVNDSWDTLSLYEFYCEKLSAVPWVKGKSMLDFFYDHQCKVTDIIERMERNGMPIDVPFLREIILKAERDVSEYEAKAAEYLGCPINVRSSPQMQHLLYGEGPKQIMKGKRVLFTIHGNGWPVLQTTDSGAPATGGEVIMELRWHLTQKHLINQVQSDWLEVLVKLGKTRTQLTYMEALLDHVTRGKVRSRINQIGATSGRWSSASPNLQNISTGEKDIYHLRDAFVPSDGYTLVVADYSQLEYRLLAHFSREPKLVKMFKEGWDLHSLTAYNIFPRIKEAVLAKFGELCTDGLKWLKEEFEDDRKRAKTLNFEIIYGVGYKTLALQLDISEAEAKRMIDGWFRGYSHVTAWMERMRAEARSGRPVYTLMRRQRRASRHRINSENKGTRGAEERTLVNAIIQGSAADVCTYAMRKLDSDPELRSMGYRIIMQIHDEIVSEVLKPFAERAKARVKEIMENLFATPLLVPLPATVGTGPAWSVAKV